MSFIRKLTEKAKETFKKSTNSSTVEGSRSNIRESDVAPPPLPSKSKTSASAPPPAAGRSSVQTRKVLVKGDKHATIKKKRYDLSDFHIDRTLGTGSFGRVHLVRLKSTGNFYAMKVLIKHEVVKMKQVEHTINERDILMRLDYPFLVELLGTMQDASNLYFVLEFVQGGELFTFLRRSGRFRNNVALFYAGEVILAFEYLHNRDIIYRDLKPENLLIDSEGHIKITDFGFAKEVPDVTWTLCGTPDYLAPEIIQSKGYGRAVDWWALGILIYEMIAGHPPFYDDDHFKLYEKILACKPKFPSHFDPNAKDLNGVEDIKRHAWFGDLDWQALEDCQIPAPYLPPCGKDGDASNFDVYDENHEPYGGPGPDPHKISLGTFKNWEGMSRGYGLEGTSFSILV
ncbi:kinase-like protein [Rhizoclosmatium globosum]|uniref:cAMP-dependent protein kinase n=1 Tax=Rhizoclosmatium globosum TaxID=329046 RepID=A0A1Y2CHH8_9FUNG|nr:kinase-like protein [Rhizoclosmatium globosum]|eukprot:ORY46462.1 kinase-like protein [Rhizoclosmatium globosum]